MFHVSSACQMQLTCILSFGYKIYSTNWECNATVYFMAILKYYLHDDTCLLIKKKSGFVSSFTLFPEPGTMNQGGKKVTTLR